MPSVDQRVVELQFDNNDFANRVSESVSSLKTLENALQMGGSAKGIAEVGNALGRMNINPMVDAAESVANKFSVMRAVAVSAINRITNGVMDSAKKVITFIPNQIISGGWNRAANIAKAKFTFEGLAKETGDSWEAMSEDINYAVQGTAYTFDAAATAASSFYASGVKLGPQMKQALRGVSGVAAMTSSEYSDIARIFTTVAGNGRLMGEQLNQISGRGINAAATLAKKLKVTEAEVRELVTKGEIDFATFAEAMDEAFGEHATDANKTFQGALSNIKAALSKIGEKFAAPLMDAMIPVLNGIRNMVSNFKDQIDPIVDVWKRTLNVLSPAVSAFFEKIASYVNTPEFASGIQNIADRFNIVYKAVDGFFNKSKKFITMEDWKKLANAPYVDMLKDKLIEVATASDENFKAMYDSYGSFEESLESGWLTKDIFKQASDQLKDMAGSLDEAGASAEDASAYLEQCWRYAYEVERGDWGNGIERFNRLTEAGLSYHDIQGLVNHDLLGWDYTLEGLNTTLRNSGKYTDEQIAAIEAFAKELDESGSSLTEFISIFDTVDKMSNFELLTGSIGNLGKSLISIFGAVGKAFSEVFSGSNVGLFDSFGEAAHFWLEQLYGWTDKLYAFASSSKVFDVAKEVFTDISFITTTVSNVVEFFREILVDVGTAFSQVFSGGNLKLLDTMGSGFKTIGDGIHFWLEKLANLSGTLNGFGSTGNMVYRVSKNIFTVIKNFGSVASKAFSGIGTVGKTLLEAFSPLGELFSDIASRVFDLVDGAGLLEGKFAWLDAITSALKTAMEALASVIGPLIEGFVEWAVNTDIVGKAFGVISDAVAWAVPKVQSAFGILKGEFEKFWPSIKTSLGKLPGLLEGIFEKVTWAIAGLSGGGLALNIGDAGNVSGIGAAFTGLVDSFTEGKDRLQSFADFIGEVFTTALEAITTFLEGFLGAKESIVGTSDDLSKSVGAASTGLSNAVDTMSEAGGILETLFDSSKGVFGAAISMVGTTIENVFKIVENITTLLKEFTSMDFESVFQYFVEGVAIVSMFKYVSAFKSLADSLSGLTDVIKTFQTGKSKLFGGLIDVNSIRPSKFFEIALAIMSLALSLWFLSTIPAADLGRATAALLKLTAAVVIVTAAMAAMSHFMDPKSTATLEAMSVAMIALAAAILLLSVAAKMMTSVDDGTIRRLVDVMLVLALSAALIGKYVPGVVSGAASVLAFAVAVRHLVGALLVLNDVGASNLIGETMIIIGIIVAMGTMLALIGKFNSTGAAIAVLALAAALAAIVVVIRLLGTMISTMDNFGTSMIAMIGIMALLAGVVLLVAIVLNELPIGAAALVAFGVACLAVAAAVLVIVAALWVLSNLNFENMINGLKLLYQTMEEMDVGKFAMSLVKVGAALIVVGVGLAVIGVGVLLVGVGMLAFAAALGLLLLVGPAVAGVLVLIGSALPSFGEGCISAGKGLLVLGAGLIVAGAGAIVAAAGLALLSAAMLFFAVALVAVMYGVPLLGKVLGGDMINGIGAGAQSALPGVLGFFKGAGDSIFNALSGSLGGGKGLNLGKGLFGAFKTNAESEMPGALSVMDTFKGNFDGKIGSIDFKSIMSQKGLEIPTGFTEGMEMGSPEMNEYMSNFLGDDMLSQLNGGDYMSMMSDLGYSGDMSMLEGMDAGSLDIKNYMSGEYADLLSSRASEIEGSVSPDFEQSGANIVNSFSNSMTKQMSSISSTLSTTAENMKKNLNVDASKEGENVSNTYGSGIVKSMGVVQAAIGMIPEEQRVQFTNAVVTSTGLATKAVGGYASSILSGVGAVRSSATNMTLSATGVITKAVSAFRSQGGTSGQGYASGIGGKRGTARSSASAVAGSARSGLSVNFYSQGSSAVQGFINGMNDLSWSAGAVAARIGSDAITKLKDSLRSASPSKETYKVGTWFVEGFANGIGDNYELSSAKAGELGYEALKTLDVVRDAIESELASDMDFNPTITPIVDLDNVKAANGMLDTMFTNSYGLSTSGMLGTYNLYGSQGLGESKSAIYNISVMLQYDAGTDASMMTSEIAAGLRAKLDLEG